MASAQLTSIGPFSGALSESFESFPNYGSNGGGNVTLPVFGGVGLFSSAGAQNWIYEPGVADWGLGSNGTAPTNSGAKAFGIYNGSAPVTTTLSFTGDVSRFGGYFNVVWFSGAPPEDLSLIFLDSSSSQIGATQIVNNIGNPLVWFGWSSTVGIRSIVMTGGQAPVMDDLQIDMVPEPASLAVLALGGLALIRRRRA